MRVCPHFPRRSTTNYDKPNRKKAAELFNSAEYAKMLVKVYSGRRRHAGTT